MSPPSTSQLLYSVRPPVDAVADAAFGAHHALVLASLIANAGNKRDELREVTAVELKLRQLLAGDGSAQFGGLRVYLSQPLAAYDDLFVNVPNLQGNVDSCVLCDAQGDAFGAVGAESFRRNR